MIVLALDSRTLSCVSALNHIMFEPQFKQENIIVKLKSLTLLSKGVKNTPLDWSRTRALLVCGKARYQLCHWMKWLMIHRRQMRPSTLIRQWARS